MAETRDETVAELLRTLSQQTTKLVHQEVELAKVELIHKGKRAGVGAGLLGGAAVAGLFGGALLLAAVVAGLANVLPVWAATLIVGAVLLAVAGVLALGGKKEIKEGSPPVPTQAVESTKEDVAWLKTQAKTAKPQTKSAKP